MYIGVRRANLFNELASSSELSLRTFCIFLRELSSLPRSHVADARDVLEELSGESERPMIISMTTTARCPPKRTPASVASGELIPTSPQGKWRAGRAGPSETRRSP